MQILPSFFRVRQHFQSRALPNVQQATIDAIANSPAASLIRPGQSVAIGVGSRGIANLQPIVATTVRCLRGLGADPFIVPAMGSHGGATAQGQVGVLGSLGVDEAFVQCQIRSSMDTVFLGETEGGIPLHIDANAAAADHVVLINRIKPHTRLTGTLQSGLCKMLMIGLGKHTGAAAFHHAFSAFDYQLDRVASEIVTTICQSINVAFGLALIEDAYDETAWIEAVPGDQFLQREPELLPKAIQWMPRLPFDKLDLLIVDQIGKEISGTGMDTNIIGRKANDKVAMPDEFPKIREIYVRSLTRSTAGNAAGIGIAEYTHQRVVDAMDRDKTRVNCLVSGHVTAGAIPVTFETDEAALLAARSQFGGTTDQIRWVRITDTLHLSEIQCSEALWDEIQSGGDRNDPCEVISEIQPLKFSDGELSP
ncbi:nickel pincer cofactor-dependent isomerase, group 22 [Stieleria varia]|uniref:LarA-like N-terminal domain-containing protein n=1 Tax=Stieleria varia TaxID=2528005 RepID=A0A5C6AN80_9BACT|nr:lactate racemase domain-containing protein [Stieleria varia]TWU00947.1 hypothetical protein Pla52n_43170 [Stieleria varia]